MKESYIINNKLREGKRRENLHVLLPIYRDNSSLPDSVIILILMYGGMIFTGRNSLCWVQYL